MATTDYALGIETLHENEHYTVHSAKCPDDVWIVDNLGCAYPEGYCMVNKKTGVVELLRSSLPDLLYNCEHFNRVLVKQAYMWQRELEAEPTEASAGEVLN